MSKSSLVLAVLLICLTGGAAAAKTPFPEFTGQKLYVSGVPDVYQPLTTEIDRLEQASPQTYYVVVVQSSGSGQWATREYLDQMHQAWIAQAARKGLALDPDRSVIIVLAVENRHLAVHAGTQLQSHYGLRDQAIDRQLVQPHFIPHARAGNYLQGLQMLLTAIDQSISAKDAQLQKQKQEAEARAVELERNARFSLQAANRLLADVRKELEAKQASGMELEELESQVAASAERLSKLSPDAKAQAAHVLEEASLVQRQLQQVQAALLQLSAQQEQAEQVLKEAQGSVQQLQESIQAYRRDKLATQAVEHKLEETWSQMETARALLAIRPDKALSTSQSAAQQLASLKTEVSRLKELAQQTSELLKGVDRERAAVDRQLQQARKIGANTQSAQQAIEQLEQQVALARDLQQSDYQQAIQKLEAAQAALRYQQQLLTEAYDVRHFMTRTVPISAVSLAVFLVAAVLSGLRWRHVRLKRRIGENLNAFRTEVTTWMERLDSLKQRHQLLPFTDKDFTEPMAGQTLAVYTQVENDYHRLRTVWLALMDRRTKAEGEFVLERPLGIGRLRSVEDLLAAREDMTELAPQFERCVKLLDQLNQAHEEAVSARDLAQQQRAALQSEVSTLADAKLFPETLQADAAGHDASFEQASQIMRSDPLGARGTFESVLAGLRAASAVAQRRLRCLAAWRAAEQHIQEVDALALKQRAAGMKLTEEAANPDPPLAEARNRLAEAWTALERAHDDAAEKLVHESQDRAAQAKTRIERHLADKEFFQHQLPRLRDELARLRDRLEQGAAEQRELEARFHPDSWALMADNRPQAEASTSSLAGLLDEAAAVASLQHFCRAADMLRHSDTQREQASALLDSLSQGLKELEKTREAALARLQETQDLERRVAAYFAQHPQTVGLDAGRLRSSAESAARQAESASQEARPHWPQVLLGSNQAGEQFAAALSRAEEDVRHYQQLLAELSQARSHVNRVDQLLRSHTADRPRSNQRFQGARNAIEQIAQASQQPRSAWAALLEQLKQAVADLEQARRWAEEDIHLAEQAASALRSAEAEFQSSRTFVSLGVSTNLAAAQSQLAQARQSLQTLDYERAISLADAAERAARQAHLEAVREAEQRRRRQEEERRRQEMQRMAAASAAASASRNVSFGSHRASSSSGSTTSSSSWSSGTSQSSW